MQNDPRAGAFTLVGRFAPFALGYGALWFTLVLMVEAGGEELATALAVLIAAGMTAVSAEKVIANLRLEEVR